MLQHWYHSRHGDRFRLLGDIDVRLDGGRVDVGHARQRCVLAGQVAVLSGDGRAAAPLSRLLLRDMGVTYWADEALDVAGLVLAGRGVPRGWPRPSARAGRPMTATAGSAPCGNDSCVVVPGSPRRWGLGVGRARHTGHGRCPSRRRSSAPWPHSRLPEETGRNLGSPVDQSARSRSHGGAGGDRTHDLTDLREQHEAANSLCLHLRCGSRNKIRSSPHLSTLFRTTFELMSTPVRTKARAL